MPSIQAMQDMTEVVKRASAHHNAVNASNVTTLWSERSALSNIVLDLAIQVKNLQLEVVKLVGRVENLRG